jgi:hypothetical protein
MMIRQKLPWLTYGEALEIVVKRYVREDRALECLDRPLALFAEESA